MRVEMSTVKPLEELVDAKYSKSKRHVASKRLLDSLLWASENFLRCVIRERVEGGEELVRVCPELASTLAPTMSALMFLRAWAGLSPEKLADAVTRTVMKVSDKMESKEKSGASSGGGRSLKVGGESALVLSAEAQARVDSLNRRIEAARSNRK